MIVVGDNGLPSHTELFTLSSSKWQIKKGYPYSKNIYQYSILTVEKNFIIFGGHQNKMKVLNNQEKVMRTLLRYNSFNTVVKSNNFFSIPKKSGWSSQSTIARFDPIENSWAKLGNLKVARTGHGVIQVDNEFIVVGGATHLGKSIMPTESCKLNGQSMKCTTREPQLSNMGFYPVLMLTP